MEIQEQQLDIEEEEAKILGEEEINEPDVMGVGLQLGEENVADISTEVLFINDSKNALAAMMCTTNEMHLMGAMQDLESLFYTFLSGHEGIQIWCVRCECVLVEDLQDEGKNEHYTEYVKECKKIAKKNDNSAFDVYAVSLEFVTDRD